MTDHYDSLETRPPVLRESEEFAVLIFRFDDLDKAVDALQKHGIRIIPRSEMW